MFSSSSCRKATLQCGGTAPHLHPPRSQVQPGHQSFPTALPRNTVSWRYSTGLFSLPSASTTSATTNPAKLGCCRAAKVRSKVQPFVSAAVKEEKLGQWHFHWHEMKALISSDYFKSTVDLRRHRSGVMKPSCVLPAFAHKYAHRSQEFSTCRNCAVSLPYPYRNKFGETSEARRTRSALFYNKVHLLQLYPQVNALGSAALQGSTGGEDSCWQ